MVRVGVIGCGYWGPNLVRNFSALENAEVTALSDRDRARLAACGRRYPGARCHTDPSELIADPEVDAVAVCTPVDTHYELGCAVLAAGKHLLVEKPLAHSTAQARDLVERHGAEARVHRVERRAG
jgi:predicted dehydrogenase